MERTSEMVGKQTLTGQVAQALAERIDAGVYKPGEKLPTEQRLIEEFNVSRTVIREAVASLRASGAVITRQGVGAFVLPRKSSPNFQIDQNLLSMVEEVCAVLDLRIALESEAAALAAVRRGADDIDRIDKVMAEMKAAISVGDDALQADMSFHKAIALATGNDHFVSLFSYLGELVIPRSRVQTFRIDGLSRTEYLEHVHNEHQHIASAVIRGDAEAARAAMRLHLADSRERLKRHLS